MDDEKRDKEMGVFTFFSFRNGMKLLKKDGRLLLLLLLLKLTNAWRGGGGGNQKLVSKNGCIYHWELPNQIGYKAKSRYSITK